MWPWSENFFLKNCELNRAAKISDLKSKNAELGFAQLGVHHSLSQKVGFNEGI